METIACEHPFVYAVSSP